MQWIWMDEWKLEREYACEFPQCFYAEMVEMDP